MHHNHHHRRLWKGLFGGGGGGGYLRRLPAVATSSSSTDHQAAPFLIGSSDIILFPPYNNNNNNRPWLSSSSSSFTTSSFSPCSSNKRGFSRIPLLCLSPTYNGRILPVFNPSDRCFYDIPIPKEVQGPENSVRGSGHGWLVMVKRDREWDDDDDGGVEEEMILTLYNPITRAHIPLPCVASPNVIANAQVWCSPAKASPGQPMVSIMYGLANRQILIYEQGDDDWSKEIVTPPGDRISSTVYHVAEAKLYVVFVDGRLSVLDLLDLLASSSSTLLLRPLIDTPTPEIESSRYSPDLVVGADGDLLLVMGDWPNYPPTAAAQFDVFKLDRRSCLKWVRTESIGDHTLFMYENDRHIVSIACDDDPAGFTDAHANQLYIFQQYRNRYVRIREEEDTDTKITDEMPAAVQVLDLTVAAANAGPLSDQKEPLFFRTSNILRGVRFWYQQFAAWIVPSLT